MELNRKYNYTLGLFIRQVSLLIENFPLLETKASKFIFGMLRMMLNEEIHKKDIPLLNKLLKGLSESNSYYSYDCNLNGLTANEFIKTIPSKIHDSIESGIEKVVSKTGGECFQNNCQEFIDSCVKYGEIYGTVYVIRLGDKYNVLDENKKIMFNEWADSINGVYSNALDKKIHIIVRNGEKYDDIEY